MKKSKFLVLGLIALMLAGGLALASCDQSKCSGDGECVWNFPTDEQLAAGVSEGLPKQCADGCISKQSGKLSSAAELPGKKFKCDC